MHRNQAVVAIKYPEKIIEVGSCVQLKSDKQLYYDSNFLSVLLGRVFKLFCEKENSCDLNEC